MEKKKNKDLNSRVEFENEHLNSNNQIINLSYKLLIVF